MGDIVNCDQGLSLKRNVKKETCFEQISAFKKYQGNTQGCWIPRFGCTHHQHQQKIHHPHQQQQHDDDEDDVVDEAQYKSGV